MTDADKDMQMLDLLFAEARNADATPGQDLMARVMADAAAATPSAAEPGVQQEVAPALGWRSWIAAAGGWPALGGIAFGTVAGIWIGMTPSDRLTTIASGIWGETVSVQFYPEDDVLGLLEG